MRVNIVNRLTAKVLDKFNDYKDIARLVGGESHGKRDLKSR